MGEPLFTIDTILSEENYRKGLATSFSPVKILFTCLFGVAMVAYCIFAMSLGEVDWLFWLPCTAIAIGLCYMSATQKNKVIERCIFDLIYVTGKTELQCRCTFYDREILFKSKADDTDIHFRYEFIYQIYEFKEFYMLQGRGVGAVYIAKNSLPNGDTSGFERFITNKCRAAKLTRKEK